MGPDGTHTVTDDHEEWLAAQFESNREHLRAVAYRMLGSVSEAEDTVQEAWLRLSRSDSRSIENLGGWLTTVVARMCLDTLRARRIRAEAPVEAPRTVASDESFERQAAIADSVGLALLVVLETLAPAERIAFVLHDMFDLTFEEIAPIVERTPTAARQLASRARRRVQGAPVPDADRRRKRAIVEAFLAAARLGDLDGLLALLDPDVVLRGDRITMPGKQKSLRGAHVLAGRAAAAGARAARIALVDGEIAVVIAPLGRLLMVLRYTIEGDKIVEVEAIGEPERLATLELAVLDDPASA
jgi:RNA polymerase sigma factor (sigma-70 family)